MNRTLSVIRRRTNLVDVVVPIVAGVDKYRLKWNANFDGVFAQFIDSSNVGFLDAAINQAVIEVQQTTGRVRIVFNPATYGIPDAQHFWMELWHVAPGGAETQMSAPSLVLPEGAHHGIHQVTIHGFAPNGADVTHSLQIDLPRLMSDFRIHNEAVIGGNNLFVASEENGAEQQLQPDTFPQYTSFSSTQGSLWVRGGGGDVPFSAIFTMSFPR
jgi:hypothetical protein